MSPDGELIINRLLIIINEIDTINNTVQEMKGELLKQ